RQLAAIAFQARYPDTTAPVIDAASFALREGTTLEGRSIPAKLTWSATETESGVGRYDVRLSVDGGAWQTVPTEGPEEPGEQVPTSVGLELLRGHRYAFSVMATDAAGNASAWVDSPVIRARIVQEKNAAIQWDDGWRFVARASASGGGVATARVVGVRASMSEEWLTVAWVSTRSPRSGAARVTVDGVPAARVDLLATSVEPRRVVFSRSWSEAADHELTIRVLDSPDRPRVDLDALVVLTVVAPP
ncbi:MAG: hypothetical protein M3432_08130, partial [Chloroflexota bacterium]|nr:hypothetical protein [Chloroflexota bacterium]